MIKTETLKSGAKLAVNEMKGFEGVSFKMFVFVGSSNEKDKELYGISHLIEHMLFKGTEKRTSLDIVNEFDKYGIQNNAYTSKDTTCYFTYGTKETLEKSVEIMSDIFFNSTFNEDELNKEKMVVIEEINMYQDMPDAVCEMALEEEFFKNTSFAHDIIGSEETVNNLTREQILEYKRKNYIPKNVVLSFAGNVTIKEAEILVEKYFESNFIKGEQKKYEVPNNTFKLEKSARTTIKDTNQAQIMIAYNTENRFALEKCRLNTIISYILGYGMSSRLFQEVREKRGLVYSILANNEANDLTGIFKISLGTNSTKVKTALKTINSVIQDVLLKGFTEEELKQAKNMIVTAIKLGSDKPSSQANILANQLHYNNRVYSKEEMIELYNKITLEEINNQAKIIFNNNYVISMVSSKDDIDLIESYENKK